MKSQPNPRATIDQIRNKYEAEIMAIPGVTGIGIGTRTRSGRAIKVYVERVTPELKARIPTELEGFPVIMETTGEFQAL